MILPGNIILKRNQAEAVTPSGIVLPESMTEELNIGTVIHVGEGKGKMAPEVSIGDTVVFSHKTIRKQEFNLHNEDVVELGFQDIYLIKKKIAPGKTKNNNHKQ